MSAHAWKRKAAEVKHIAGIVHNGMRKASVLHATLLLLLVASVLRVAHGADTEEDKKVGLTDLAGVEALMTKFNADAGSARLVLLFSPT